MTLRPLVAVGPTLLAVTACAPLTLVRDGRTTAAIVVAAKADANEKLAATELQTYLKKISDAELPIVTARPSWDGPLIRIGVFGSDAVGEWRGSRPAPEGFVSERKGDTLYVVGGNANGVLNGVYDFLESQLDVRWFMPGELGEDVPVSRTVTVADFRREDSPAFDAIGGFAWAYWTVGPSAQIWERRIRARIGSPSAFFGHNWGNIIPPTAANKRDHPEWFALNNGERTNQLCSAHPDVVRITIEKARQYFDANPSAQLFSISPNDGYGFCQDARCQAVDQLYGVTDGSLTDRFVHYANEVLEGLGQTHPDKQVGILAYVEHTRPPVSAKPHPNYVTLICHTPWEFCHVHAINDPRCERNQRFLGYVRGWTAVARHVGIYDYYGHFYIFAPWPIVPSIRQDLPLLHDLGVDRFESETQPNWANQGINFYLAAKLAWNPRLDVDRLLAEYYTRFYGRAAAPMRRYWERWEQAMQATAAQGDGGYEWLRMFTPELVAECDSLLAEAEKLAADDRPIVARRLAFNRIGLRFTEAWTRMRWHGDRHEWAQAVAAGEEAVRVIEGSKGADPSAFSLALAVGQTQAMMKPYRDALAAQ